MVTNLSMQVIIEDKKVSLLHEFISDTIEWIYCKRQKLRERKILWFLWIFDEWQYFQYR